MAEIDFDELDKAVNSLMDSATKKAAPQEENTSSLVESPEPIAVDAQKPEQSTSEPEESPAQPVETSLSDSSSDGSQTPMSTDETPSSPAPAPLATKRRGQFMDMKHSSADMRTAPTPMAAKPMSRVGTTLAPISSVVTHEEAPTEEPVAAPKHSITEEDAKKEATPLLDAPDPVDAITATSEVNDDDTDGELPPLEKEDTAPVSPFLPDAKVEKRPLGTPEPVVAESSDDEQSSNDAPAPVGATMTHGVALEAPASAEPIAPATIRTTLPKELHSSVLEVEADTTAAGESEDDAETAAESTPETKDVVASVDSATPEAKTDATVSAAAASIPPQYTAKKPAEDAEPQASMYDNAVDHPALAQPKKTSHWAVVIIIIILVLLGALGGAALYLYQTGALSLI